MEILLSDTGNFFLSSLKLRDFACRSYKSIHLKEYTCMYTSIVVYYYSVPYHIKYCILYNFWTLR